MKRIPFVHRHGHIVPWSGAYDGPYSFECKAQIERLRSGCWSAAVNYNRLRRTTQYTFMLASRGEQLSFLNCQVNEVENSPNEIPVRLDHLHSAVLVLLYHLQSCVFVWQSSITLLIIIIYIIIVNTNVWSNSRGM